MNNSLQSTGFWCGEIEMIDHWRGASGADSTPRLILALLFLANCALIPVHDHHDILDGDLSLCAAIQAEDDHHSDCPHLDEGSALDCCRLLGDQRTSPTLKQLRSARASGGSILPQGIDWFIPDRNPAPVVREADRLVPRLFPLAYPIRAPPFRHTA